MSETIIVDIQDSCWPLYLYPTREAVYGKGPVTLPVDLYNRWIKANDEFEAIQEEIKKYYDDAQKVKA